MALAVLVLMLRRRGAVYTMGHLMDHIEEIADYRPSECAVRDSVKLARKVLVKAEWPVTIRTEYGIGYSVTWPHGWTMPQAGGNAMPCAEDTSPTSHAPAGDTRS